VFSSTRSEEAVIVEEVASLVLAAGQAPEAALLDELTAAASAGGLVSSAGRPVEVHGIGDCLAPRTVEEAVLEGLRVAAVV
jgi:hypothetical protein